MLQHQMLPYLRNTQSGLAAAGVHFGAVRLGIFLSLCAADDDLVLVIASDESIAFRLTAVALRLPRTTISLPCDDWGDRCQSGNKFAP